MQKKLREFIVCPKCRSALEHDVKAQELLCRSCRLAYPVRDGIPVLIEAGARKTGEG
ncbi:MAG TPA: Trm112 family protein [Gammaproteobacteria bacterium]|nr:Trm112 family protein [Gammaproteobacteria bacterium]